MRRLDALDWLVIAACLVAFYVITAMIIQQVTLPPAPDDLSEVTG